MHQDPTKTPLAPHLRDLAITLVALAGFAWFCIDGSHAGPPGLVLALGLGLVAATPWPRAEARLLALLAGSTGVATMLMPPIWPLTQLVVGGPVVVVALWVPTLRLRRPWLLLGRLDPWPVVALGVLAAVALVAWVVGMSPDLSQAFAMFPGWPWPVLVVAAVGFSLVNAILEEVAFRGVLQQTLRSWLGPGVWPVLLQGAAFGVLHWHGVPHGPLGALMAGSWGVMLGWARQRSGGLLTPVLAHVVADAVIFAVLATHAGDG